VAYELTAPAFDASDVNRFTHTDVQVQMCHLVSMYCAHVRGTMDRTCMFYKSNQK
jgi:hypothetical protein